MRLQSINYGQPLFTGKQDCHIRKADVKEKAVNPLTAKAIAMGDSVDEPISIKGKKLVKSVSSLIEDTWGAIKQGKVCSSEPNFMVVPNKSQVATIRPIYNGIYKKMLVEVQNGKEIERMIVNREIPAEYSYEKSILTDFGSATTKSFDSTLTRNSAIEKRVNRLLENILPEVLKKYHL